GEGERGQAHAAWTGLGLRCCARKMRVTLTFIGRYSPAPMPPDRSPTDVLSRPLPLKRGKPLPNRIAKASMSEQLGEPGGGPGDGWTRLYRRWAGSGGGLLLTGNVMVDPAALGEPGNVVVEDGRHLPMLRKWAEVSQAQGAQAWMQINHPGRQSPKALS